MACCVPNAKEYKITVETGDKPVNGNEARVYLALYSGQERIHGQELKASFSGKFKRGHQTTYKIKTLSVDYPAIDKIELSKGHDDDDDTDWFIDTIRVEKKAGNWNTVFPVFIRINEGEVHCIHEYDTHLPDDKLYTEHPALLSQRQRELKTMQEDYQYQYEPGIQLVTLKKLPKREEFSFSYTFNLISMEFGQPSDILPNMSSVPVDAVDSADFKDLSDFVCLFKKPFAKPHELDRWESDEKFGLQRLLGVNSSVIRRVRNMEQLEKLKVDDKEIQPLLQGLTLKQAMDARKLFIVDHAILDKVPKGNPDITICSPISLFVRNGQDKLMPVAIQLFQEQSDDNPVFYPTDDKYTWILAKMWFNNADAQIHQAISHLGYTHIIMGGFAIAAHRSISKSHPIFKLLAPHLLYLMAINDLGLKTLVNKGGLVDKLMSMGSTGADYLMAKYKDTWRLNVEGCLPADIADRGVEEADIPLYPFRDDAKLTYQAIETYVDSYVSLYYSSDQDLQKDPEIQAWRHDMDLPALKGGLGVRGVPGSNGRFQKREELALVLKCIIYTCSVGHAAVNFKQYDEYAFPLNYPMKLLGSPPRDKTKRDMEHDVIPAIQPKGELRLMMLLTKLLSTRATRALGYFEVNFIHDPAAVRLVEQFRNDLGVASEKITKRNTKRTEERAYPFLNPAQIPNAISI